MENDYLNPEMTPVATASDTTTPRIFGVLNIIFSLLAACMAAYALMMAIFMPVMAKTMEEARVAAQEATTEEIEALEEKEAAASTDEEKADIREEIDALESAPTPANANPFAAMQNPKVLLYSMVDGATGLFFNLLMFISGVGLLLRKEWARKLAVWTAGLKIIRLLVLQAVNIVIIVPINVKSMQEMYEQMNIGGQGMGNAEMAGMQGVMLTSWAVVLIVGGSIYPALSLWFLSRPGVKAACQSSVEELPAQ